VCFQVQLFVAGQAGGVSEQHAECDVVTAGIEFAAVVGEEFRENADDRGVEFEEASLVEDGSSGGGRDYFRDGGYVEEGRGGKGEVYIPALSRRARQGRGTPGDYLT